MRLMKVLSVTIIAMAFFAVAAAAANVKDSRSLNLRFDATVAGAHLAMGNYNVQWQRHSPEATVSFLQGSKVVATAEAKVVDRGTKYENDEVVFDEAADGTRMIRELHFAGSREAIEFKE